MPPKRACDTCISRKVKCSGSWPCDTCRDSAKQVPCTYLRLPRRRGPKVRRASRQSQGLFQPLGPSELQSEELLERHFDAPACDIPQLDHSSEVSLPPGISKNILASIIRLYQKHSYSVWPIINTDSLLVHLRDVNLEDPGNPPKKIDCLVTALCAATMAQLQLAPMEDRSWTVDSTAMAQTCLRIKSECYSDKTNVDLTGILVSFFLHVYHAKVNQCTTAMMYIQEAISDAKSLHIHEEPPRHQGNGQGHEENSIIANRELVFPLLWVSERGYAMHLGLSPSCVDPPVLTGFQNPSDDPHVIGLLDLVRLFIAFDQISKHRKSGNEVACATYLKQTENRLSSLCFNLADQISTRTADCHITREWMRTILWQEALSMGLLSSSTSTDVMTFSFPAKVSRDLLHSLRLFSETDLLPLGRDQLLKCFEVANSLADTALLSVGSYPSLQISPKDFLHALYQKLSPFLEQDPILNSILRAKTAEVLVRSPARLLILDSNSLGADSSARSLGVPGQEVGKEACQTNLHSISEFEDHNHRLMLPTEN